MLRFISSSIIVSGTVILLVSSSRSSLSSSSSMMDCRTVVVRVAVVVGDARIGFDSVLSTTMESSSSSWWDTAFASFDAADDVNDNNNSGQ